MSQSNNKYNLYDTPTDILCLNKGNFKFSHYRFLQNMLVAKLLFLIKCNELKEQIFC